MQYNEFLSIYKETVSDFSDFHEVDLMCQYIISQGYNIEISYFDEPGKAFHLPGMKVTAKKDDVIFLKEDIYLKDSLKFIVDKIEGIL